MTEELYDWLIWSYEHAAWWCARSFGYTKDINQAGRYTRTEAMRICDNANRYSTEIQERAVHVAEVASFNPRANS
jgi:hypothetical protein